MKKVALSIRVDRQVANKILARAKALNTSQSALLRDLLIKALDSENRDASAELLAELAELKRLARQSNQTASEHFDLHKRLIEALAAYQDGWAI